MVVGKWSSSTLRVVGSPVFLSHEWLLVPSGFLFSRDFQKLKFLRFSKNSRTFHVVDIFLTSLWALFWPNCKFFYRIVCYHTMVSLVWLQTELDSTQSYYHYLLRTQIIMSDLRSACKIWTALILRKINLRAAKSWFDSPSSRCWSSLTVPSCQTRETEIETHSVFFDWFENGR